MSRIYFPQPRPLPPGTHRPELAVRLFNASPDVLNVRTRVRQKRLPSRAANPSPARGVVRLDVILGAEQAYHERHIRFLRVGGAQVGLLQAHTAAETKVVV